MANYENGNVYGGVSTVENPAEFKPAGVPTKISTWSKIRNFLFKEINYYKQYKIKKKKKPKKKKKNKKLKIIDKIKKR